ncbi:hypothetical protein [Enterococcus sp. CWB-B31]|uniref:hypothetical protein n=1 Tax=Enterococcus sp. CWB-B31 TaxID=2885159 RepID=UPI001E58A8BE|nr:hypothetical protein [Enterococcus sp. CWB-B31]MCB5953761.1 hypothetical protein [Enterococcus sp. CWB-B31]
MEITAEQLLHYEKIPSKKFLEITNRLKQVAEHEDKELLIAIYQDQDYKFHWAEPEQKGNLEDVQFLLEDKLLVNETYASLVCIIHSHLLNLNRPQFSIADNIADMQIPFVISVIFDCAAVYKKQLSTEDLNERYFRFRTSNSFEETFKYFDLDDICKKDRSDS